MNRCSPVVRVANFFLSEGFVKGDSVAVFMANAGGAKFDEPAAPPAAASAP